MIRVLLADDHAVLRDGLRFLLAAAPEIEVVGDACDGEQAVAMALQLQPDVIVMDISMPGVNGIDATARICKKLPETRIIILSMQGASEYIFRALRAGATGYLLKDSAGKEVVNAVHMVATGSRYFSQQITETLVQDYMQTRPMVEQKNTLDTLSRREQEILQLVIEGHSSAEIGQLLFLSPKTVETYRSRMMQKLGVSDLAGLIRFALQNGLSKSE